ncbi:hypothetical protein XENTR_v10022289 [Xenopus tropicalis]|nr:hypothetical protein XENTR_v10022289 [Xenopus tropicalis]
MEMRVLWLLLFAGSMAEDMDSKVFLFPKRSIYDYVVLKPMVTGPLHKLTICLRSYTDGNRYALLNVGIPKSRIRNMFVIAQEPANSLTHFPSYVYINNARDYINANTDWIHRCVTWASDTGVLQLWVNGKASIRKVVNKGFSIDLQDGISLGQMRRYYGYNTMEWDPEVSFQGEISDVYVWNEVLPPETIWQVLLGNKDRLGNVINWKALKYTINGDVTVQPKLQCRYGSESGSSHHHCSMV